MNIQVKKVPGNTINCTISKNGTVEELKAKISDAYHILPSQQKMIFKGKVLSDNNKNVSEYGIVENDVVTLVLLKVNLISKLFSQNLGKQHQIHRQ